MPGQKELHYFYRDKDFEQGKEFYAEYFKDAGEGQLCGEASPTYLTHGYALDGSLQHSWKPDNDSAVRMKQEFPEMKIIISLRNPVRRAHSFFWRTVWQGHEKTRDFETAIQEELDGMRTPKLTPLCPLYLSHYKIHLEHWFKHFSQDNVLLLVMEEWTKQPAQTIARIEDFIGAQSSGLKDTDIQKSNEGRRVVHPVLKPLTKILPSSRVMRAVNRRFFSKQGYEDIRPETAEKLRQIFEDDIKFVEEIMGLEIPAWR